MRRAARYAGAPLRVRAHVALRWWSCPFPKILARIPLGASILDYGCGHGLLALEAAIERDAKVLGVDIDERKIDAARRAAVEGTEFRVIAPGHVPEGRWDAICAVDVLYLLPRDDQRALIAQLASRLADGGVLIVKEMDVFPKFKAAWMRAQERLMVRVLGATRGATLTFTDPREVAAAMAEAGLDVEGQRVDRGYPHPHHLLVGRA
jgi:2-polyprenyl-3-methyl-5-hydroxy-6-metoxy-1,4-benzoquinol methylase